MSQTKKPAGTKKRNAKGQFVKGNKIGEETRFQKENEAACKYKEEYCDKLMEFFNQPDVDIQYKEVFDKQEVETSVSGVGLDDKTRALIERVERRLHDGEKKE